MEALDQYIEENQLPPPTFMKVDIEGAETAFLRGATQTIMCESPVMVIEFHSGALLRDGYESLTQQNYEMF